MVLITNNECYSNRITLDYECFHFRSDSLRGGSRAVGRRGRAVGRRGRAVGRRGRGVDRRGRGVVWRFAVGLFQFVQQGFLSGAQQEGFERASIVLDCLQRAPPFFCVDVFDVPHVAFIIEQHAQAEGYVEQEGGELGGMRELASFELEGDGVEDEGMMEGVLCEAVEDIVVGVVGPAILDDLVPEGDPKDSFAHGEGNGMDDIMEDGGMELEEGAENEVVPLLGRKGVDDGISDGLGE